MASCVIFIYTDNSVNKMRVAISSRHIIISDKLAKEMNMMSKKFDLRSYSKIENIDSMLLNRDISVEKKKRLLIEKLHSLVAKTFAISRKNIAKAAFNSLANRLLSIRKIVMKLRSINNYLETTFLNELNFLELKVPVQNNRFRNKRSIANDELEALEYMAYNLIGKVVVLDKRLLAEYKSRERNIISKEKIEVRDLASILGKESGALEHLEAKLPPPRLLPAALKEEPLFTQWVSRILALLSYLEHQYGKEMEIFSRLKKNKTAKSRIGKKIVQLARERSRLLDIMDDKAASMNKFRLDGEIKKELRKLTTTITL